MPFDGKDFDLGVIPRDVDILREARAHIALPDGWSQRHFRDGDARCAMGAMFDGMAKRRMVGCPDALDLFAARMLVPVLETPERWMYRGQTLVGWSVSIFNDSRQTSKSDVLALFDRGIERAETSIAYRRAHFPTRLERWADRLRALCFAVTTSTARSK